jgi:hypothetical protein
MLNITDANISVSVKETNFFRQVFSIRFTGYGPVEWASTAFRQSKYLFTSSFKFSFFARKDFSK